MRIVFIGTGEIGLPTLQMLQGWREHKLVGIVTQPDKPVGREQEITAPAIKKAIQQVGIAGATSPCELEVTLLQPAKIKHPQAIEDIHALKPDVIVVMAYGQILPRAVLEIPKVACLNLHASLLPRWRGAAPIQAAIAAGDRDTGITVMYMNEGLDTGDILLQKTIAIAFDETGASLHDKLAQIAPEALADAIVCLEKGNAPRLAQKSELATHAPKLERADGRIDWTEPAAMIERKIRAFNPWPGAFMELDHRNLKIFSATVVNGSGKPGEILRTEDALIVATGDGALSLAEVQLQGKRRMNVAEFLRGYQNITGATEAKGESGLDAGISQRKL
jgi:methionyl-tRNA formyltransferase